MSNGSYYYPPTVSGPLCQQDVWDAELAAGRLRECQVCGNYLDPDPDLVCECGEETEPNPNYLPPVIVPPSFDGGET